MENDYNSVLITSCHSHFFATPDYGTDVPKYVGSDERPYC